MKKNLGTIDRTLRFIAGASLIGHAISSGHLWAWLGLIPLLTAIVGFCPAYCPLRLSTRGGCGGCTGSCDDTKCH